MINVIFKDKSFLIFLIFWNFLFGCLFFESLDFVDKSFGVGVSLEVFPDRVDKFIDNLGYCGLKISRVKQSFLKVFCQLFVWVIGPK